MYLTLRRLLLSLLILPGLVLTGVVVNEAYSSPVTTTQTKASINAKTDTTYIYFIGVGNANRWCIADPAKAGKPGGAGTHLVLWGCQNNIWFGWRAVLVKTGKFGNIGYDFIVSQANGLCMQTTKGLAGGAVFMAKCNPASYNQMWIALDKNANVGWLQSLNSTGGGLNLANNHGTLRNGNPIVGWRTFPTCPQIPADELWTALQGVNYVHTC